MRKGARMPGRRLVSWRNGVASLPKALAASLGEDVRTGVTVHRIRRRGGIYSLDLGRAGRLAAANVVLAVQPHVAAGLLEHCNQSSPLVEK